MEAIDKSALVAESQEGDLVMLTNLSEETPENLSEEKFHPLPKEAFIGRPIEEYHEYLLDYPYELQEHLDELSISESLDSDEDVSETEHPPFNSNQKIRNREEQTSEKSAVGPTNFLKAIFHTVPQNAVVPVLGFAQDPKKQKDWGPKAAGEQLPSCIRSSNNTYFGISSLYPDENGKIRAGKKYIAATHAVMVDDLGSGSGSKGDIDGLKLPPSWVVETSPDNYQAGYIFKVPITDQSIANKITGGLASGAGGDEGAKNLVRWTRMPYGSNTKSRVTEECGGPFETKLTDWNPEKKYTPDEIATAYGIDLKVTPSLGNSVKKKVVSTGKKIPKALMSTAKVESNDPLCDWLEENEHLSGVISADGWHVLNECPWAYEHTDKSPSGAAYGPPHTGTGDDGHPIPKQRFKCQHGHCSARKMPAFLGHVASKGYQIQNSELIYASASLLGEMVNHIIEQTEADIGVCFEDRSIAIFKVFKQKYPAEWQRARAKLKRIDGLSIGDFEKTLKNDPKNNDEEEKKIDQLDIASSMIEIVDKKNLLYCLSSFWKWNDSGVWEAVDDRCLKKEVHLIMLRYFSEIPITLGQVAGVLDLAKTECFIQGQEFNENKSSINCLNGELDFVGGEWELSSHEREHYRTTQIPVNFDQSAEAPRFKKFIYEIFDSDKEPMKKARLIMECIGYTLTSSCDYEKFIMLIGQGANGKSVLLSVLEALVGRKNVAAVQPSQFENKFQRSHLKDKLANIVSELKVGAKIDDEALKAITSGEASTVEQKHKTPYELHPYSTCWFGTNHLPHTKDFSNAMFRRAIVIPFNRVFMECEQDRGLKNALINELPGILNLALEAFKGVIETGVFTHVQEVEEAKNDWRIETDQVTQFVEDCCKISTSTRIETGELYIAYTEWADDNGIHNKIAKTTLSARLKRFGVVLGKTSGMRVLIGIALNN
jgi:P4 family phage/plasmid primase-like protien